ncbi:hypothetical protein PRIPAC_73852 [Pristionchus pacificus]|uniref:Uncharacterized protein n=1 Tax=Pristionchus pacificus TaxID=54126 RepID=A0A2A6CFZ1_PRIPA|nr:hypothetical protein PRIPAC_73852 [Pristionchus pacificus]|eukprot:PDM77059.1 hypothetical protein PRIPAC_42454 [Pristionchus pacificus]
MKRSTRVISCSAMICTQPRATEAGYKLNKSIPCPISRQESRHNLNETMFSVQEFGKTLPPAVLLEIATLQMFTPSA